MSTARVDFTLGAAERIANVVRVVERGNRDETPLSFDRILDVPSKAVKLCAWTGEWKLNSTHEITFSDTFNTATATNAYFGFRPTGSNLGRGVVVKSQGTWHLVTYSLAYVQGYASSFATIQLLGHEIESDSPDEGIGVNSGRAGYLKWYSITTCESSV